MSKVQPAKLETYGPRKCPLLRSPRMTDAEWDRATLEFDDTMRRAGRKITWRTRFTRCPKCGANNLDTPRLTFGALSGLCTPCSDAARASLLREFGL